jgi:hypothetical protein
LVSGEYYAFLCDSTSFSLQKGTVNPLEDYPADDVKTVDCRWEGVEGEDYEKSEKKALELPDSLGKVCDTWVDLNGDGGIEPEHETWMGQSPWWIVHEELNAWRGEAILTGEGDLQIGFHHRLPGGADARFSFTVDPTFAPKHCNPETGEAEPYDGSWLDGWNGDLKNLPKGSAFDHMQAYKDNGQLYYFLTSGFQLNPDETTEFWYLPEQWESAVANGKFAEEDFVARPPRWAPNDLYEFFEVYDPSEGGFSAPGSELLYWCDMEEGEDPSANGCFSDLTAQLADYSSQVKEDYDDVKIDWGVLIHDNLWREPDGENAGFDGWQGLHYNHVIIEGDIAEGESLKGAFTLVLDGLDSNSRFLYRGEFEVDSIRVDKWTTADLRADKLEENGNELCVLQ